jgi:hypothetical protein
MEIDGYVDFSSQKDFRGFISNGLAGEDGELLPNFTLPGVVGTNAYMGLLEILILAITW